MSEAGFRSVIAVVTTGGSTSISSGSTAGTPFEGADEWLRLAAETISADGGGHLLK